MSATPPAEKFCIFAKEGKNYIFEPYYRCKECHNDLTVAICTLCAETCHKGHNLEYVDFKGANYYCDCGEGSVFATSCTRMPDIDTSMLEGDVKLQCNLVHDGAISPINLRAAVSTASRAFGIEDGMPFSYKAHPYLSMASGVFGTVPNDSGNEINMPFPCVVSKKVDASTINTFVSDATNGKIPTLLSDSDCTDATTAIVAALHFKGNWLVPFDDYDTKTRDFAGSEKTVSVQMMRHMNHFSSTDTPNRRFIETNSLTSICLPYEDARFCAIFTRLKTGANVGDWLAESDGSEYQDHLTMKSIIYEATYDIMLPKFKIESSHSNVLNALEKVGLPKSFATTTGVDTVIHRVVLEVNEKGTEGAAATAMIARGPMSVRTWYGNVPFLFAIRDNYTGATIFSGLVDLSLQ